MDARPLLETLARALHDAGLEAILIGNAAAALRGAPVTTIDFDFFFRKTPRNLQKLKAVAKALGAVLFRPHYPISGLNRLIRDDDGLHADFMSTIDGVRSFAQLRARSDVVNFGGYPLLVASLAAVVQSKRAAGRPRDKAVLDILERVLHEEEARDKKAKARSPQDRK
jgi:predicted nucleotidyltransferase